MSKIIKISQCFTELFQKLHWHSFLGHDVGVTVWLCMPVCDTV